MIFVRKALIGVSLGCGLAGAVLAAGDKAHEEAPAAELPPIEPLPVDTDPKAPYRLVRTLEALQDQTSLGNKAAHAAQRPLIRRLAEELSAAAPEVWKDPRNGRAIVSYVLSGGDPIVLQKLMDDKIEISGVDPKLIGGAIAFANRRNEEARVMLSPLDPHSFPAGLGGRLALVQGILLADMHAKEALKKFSIARLLAPGSLVEQGALRRQAIVASKSGDWSEAERLAAIYLRRFGNAVYAATFYRELVELLAVQPDTHDEAHFKRLAALFDRIEPKLRRQTYLLLAENAIIQGNVSMARFASANASALYDAGTSGSLRSQVYSAAADVASDQTPDGVAALSNVDRSKLGVRDTLLVGAALEIGADVRREPEEYVELLASQKDDATPQTVMHDAAAHADVAVSTPVMDLARKSIGKVDELLKADKK